MRRLWRKFALWRYRSALAQVALLRGEMQEAIDQGLLMREQEIEHDLTRAIRRSHYWAGKTPLDG